MPYPAYDLDGELISHLLHVTVIQPQVLKCWVESCQNTYLGEIGEVCSACQAVWDRVECMVWPAYVNEATGEFEAVYLSKERYMALASGTWAAGYAWAYLEARKRQGGGPHA